MGSLGTRRGDGDTRTEAMWWGVMGCSGIDLSAFLFAFWTLPAGRSPECFIHPCLPLPFSSSLFLLKVGYEVLRNDVFFASSPRM